MESSRKTGITYDESMAEHKCLWDDNYNEKPERFIRILQRCREYGLVDRCMSIEPRNVTDEELLKLHVPEMISILKGTDGCTDEQLLEELSSRYDFLFIHPSTYRLSLLSAGSTIELVDSILGGKVRNGMAIIRPPGHHAMKSEYCGYCYYNNVALAAQHALDNKGLKKILIVDWDIHHGQATQQMFYDDPRVLYFSIHGYQNGAFWPHLRESDYHNIGRGAGLGYNVNVPLNQVKMGNDDYMAIFHQILLPMAHEFQPELIIVSAGYDAALGCPEGEMEVTPACYAHFTSALMGLAHGRVAVVLEGGYCLKSLAEGAALTLRTLLGDPCPVIDKFGPPCQSVKETIFSVLYVLRNLWKCFQHVETFSLEQVKEPFTGIVADQFWPRIEFCGLDEKPERYQTRGICPTQDPVIAHQLDLQLDALISKTSLDVPKHRVSHLLDKVPDVPELLNRCHRLQDGADQLAVLDSILSGESRSGILISASPIRAAEHALSQGLKRILILDWFHGAPKSFQDDQRVLFVSFRHSETSQGEDSAGFIGLDPARGFTINLSLPKQNFGPTECLTALYRVLLPIFYQFGPELILVAAGQGGDTLEQMIHSLTALAGGRLAVILNEIELSTACLKPLSGEAVSVPFMEKAPDSIFIERLKELIGNLSPFWNCLQFQVKVPDFNVLVAPWCNDPKVVEQNPQLLQMKTK